MLYLVIKAVTKTEDSQFVGVVEFPSIIEAKKFANDYSKKMGAKYGVSAATKFEISFKQKDAELRDSKLSTLPKNFDINKAKRLN